ncbi:hypothetical protein [Pelotomaculum propionicicum]|uniref:Uncharacterized protein n=1 Tax=Pelotomaculum propionicicum TaxID=258475 RepID=A0A4Y7RJF8_9FIRM|nr:hypothetical protein [Pelotomaculum propionicicum]TEB08963.1 hypothetical protein Pmgp_03508 [Pelotomaculum propionicicum]
MTEYNILGKPIPRLDSRSKVTGETKHLNDITRQRRSCRGRSC